MKGKPALVTFGLGGHTVYHEPVTTMFGPNKEYRSTSHSTLQGYESPEGFEKRDLTPEGAGAFEGVPVVDGRAAYSGPKGVSLALHGPMPKPGLTEPERFRDIPGAGTSFILDAFAHGNGEQKLLAGLAKASLANEAFTGMDSLPVPMYVEWCRQNLGPHGGRVGVIRQGRIEWEL